MIMGSAVQRQKTGYAATGDKAGRRQKSGQRWPYHGHGATYSGTPLHAAKQ